MESAIDPAGLYETLMATSILSTAKFIRPDVITCQWTYKHRASNSSVSLSTRHSVASDSPDKCHHSVPVPVEPLLLSADCTRNCCTAFIRKSSNKNDSLHLEIIRRAQPALSVSLKSVCQSVPKNCVLSGASFSPDCSAVAFIGDKFEAPRKSFWPNSDCPQKPTDQLGTEYDYIPSCGEGIPQRHPIVILCQISANILNVRRLENFGDECLWGQICWHPQLSNILIATGFPNDPRRLGLLHYQTRPSALYAVDTSKDEKSIKLTKGDHSASFGRFSPNGKYLVYFTTDNVPWHGSCLSCRVYHWETGQSRTVVEIVRKNENFPGLFLRGVPNKIWLSDNTTFIISTQWRCQMAPIAINVESGSITRISLPDPYHSGSAEILDICENMILAKVEDVDRIPVPMLCTVNVDSNGKIATNWKLVSHAPCPPPALPPAKYELIRTPISESTDFMESILVYPQESPEESRLVLFPHGGPHSGFSTNYSVNIMFMLAMGFSVLQVNYRGSTGFGQDALESLPGKCGQQDVEDCMSVLETVLQTKKFFSRNNLAVTGGSHGGFLTLWLIGRYPNTFKAAVSRNPVANIAHMIATSDIPDWCAVECGIEFSPQAKMTGEQYKKMYEASPISVIDNVKTPLLLLLGDADKRCPMSQSIDYYKQLRSLGAPCRCIIYPENGHSLTDRVDTEADHWVNVVHWLRQ